MYANASTRPRGLGAASPSVNMAGQGAGLAVGAMGSLASLGASMSAAAAAAGTTSALGSALSFSAIGGPFAIAIAGIAVAVFELLSNVFGLGSGCGQTCVMATDVVNKLEPYLQQNLDAYLSGHHTRSEQAAALQLFDSVWAAVSQGCSAGPLANTTAGRNCTADRQSGACKWKSSSFGWQQQGGKWTYVRSGSAGSGSQCWNWFAGYRDGIANDPTVVPDPSPITSAAASAGNILSSVESSLGVSSIPTPILIAAGLVGAALILPRLL